MAHAAYIADRIQGPVSFHDPLIDNANDSEGANTTMTFDILDYLATHYGFVCPLSQQNPQSVDNKAWDNCMKALGRVAGSSNPPLPDFHESIICFIGALQTKDGPDSDNFNAFPDNCVTINSRQFFDTIAQVDSFFVVQPHAFRYSLPWSIAVYDLPQALFVYRLLLQDDHSPASLAHILLEEGVAFRTLLPLADVYLKISLRDIVTWVIRKTVMSH